MSKRLTTEEFIQKSKQIHGDKYDYSKVDYINAYIKVNIICNIHGKFIQRPNDHLNNKSGCPLCAIKFKSSSTDKFINKSKKIHNNKYDYSQTNYINSYTKICIICPEHYEFWQSPQSHLLGKGCLLCSNLTIKKFIQQSKIIHNNKYNYSKTKLKDSKSKVCIICSKHGEFYQTAQSHMNGTGCPKCQRSKGEEQIESWLKENNIQYETQKRFKDCKNILPLPFDFYLIEHNICIEYDGHQHYEKVPHWDKNWKFQRTQMNDNIKNIYCQNNNIKLLRIPYWEFKNIEQILKENLAVGEGLEPS